MRKADLLSSMEARLPFRVAQRMLRASGFPRGQSWPSIREKIQASTVKRNFDALNELYQQSIISSEKSVQMFNVGSDKRKQILLQLQSLEPNLTNVFAKKYPYIVDQKTLSKGTDTGAVFVAKEVLSFGLAVIFSTVRISDRREPIAPMDLPKSFRDSFSTIYGIRRVYEQSYDAVIVPSDGSYIWIAADFPLYCNGEYADYAHFAVRKSFNDTIGSQALNESVNLFPVIGKFYSAPEEGSILSLSHLVSTSSVKHEKMRNGNCLREELFHKAGADAVQGNLAAFAVGISWEVAKDDVSIEIFIEGRSKDASLANATVSRATIRKCSTPEELLFALDKIENYV